jgi:hypothetical protein
MYAKRVVPILLMAGAVMIMKHNRRELMGQCEDHEKRGPIGPRGEWGKRVPPLFEKWHTAAHASEAQAAAPAPAI